MRALVCEVNPGVRAVISRALFLRGHEVSAHGELPAAFTEWQARSQPLVIVGWQDGQAFEFCHQIRSIEGGADVVVLVVGSEFPRDLLLPISEYADDLVSPEPEHLAARIAVAERRVADTEQRRQAQEQLVLQALHDPLTGLPNRALLSDRLAQSLRVAHRRTSGLAILVIDLDRFKEVNDTYGHRAGDLVLREVADRLRGALRSSDTVARIGGDELAVLLPSIEETSVAVAAARKIIHTLCAPYAVDGTSVTVGASVGLAIFPVHGLDGDTLLFQADAAMYVAKRAGGGIALASGGTPAIPVPVPAVMVEELDSAIRAGALRLPTADGRMLTDRRSQAELLRTIGQDLDRHGTHPSTIICEDSGYRIRENGNELWFALDDVIRESTSRALRRQPR